MKITIYELLGMIKDNKAPIKIFYRGRERLFEYDCYTKDYYCNDFDEYLFDEYIITSILNDEVEILDNIKNNKQDKIEKLEKPNGYSTENYIEEMFDKINEIIDKLNKE